MGLDKYTEFLNKQLNMTVLSPNLIKIGDNVISVKHISSFDLSHGNKVLRITPDSGIHFYVYGANCVTYYETLIELLK
jgi:hypothetical protein